MEKIYLKGLKMFAYHGVNEEEKSVGQNFILDIRLKADLSAARVSDNLKDTVNYASVRKTVQRVFLEEKHDLIEHAAEKVCEAVLKDFEQVEKITLKLKKPEAPMNAEFDYVAVKITKRREAR